MPEIVNDKQVFSLQEVTKSIQNTLSSRYKSSFWVKAEMNKLNFYKHSGHCYPELVEKSEGKVIALMKAHLWKNDYNRVNTKFQDTLHEPLKDGIKILFQAKITFNPEHGLALWITDIDPSYTLGDLEREKQETINRLKAEGIHDKNKKLKLPALPQRIAIISVETSKGYVDFLKVIDNNSWKYKYFHMLFPALLQGDNAVQSICNQLHRIKKVQNHFDVVAIIRGGGGDVGLSCYNNYNLVKEIANFPIPVLTGIGHATNETVSEMVSFTNQITPTKLGEYLLQKFHNFSVPVQDAEKKLIDKSKRLLSEKMTKFNSEVKLFRSVTENILSLNRNEVRSCLKSVQQNSNFILKNEQDYIHTIKINIIKNINLVYIQHKQDLMHFGTLIKKDSISHLNKFKLLTLQLNSNLISQCSLKFKSSLIEINSIEKSIKNMSPQNVLKRGYSITLINGKTIKNIDQVKTGDTLQSSVFEGQIISIVHSKHKTTES